MTDKADRCDRRRAEHDARSQSRERPAGSAATSSTCSRPRATRSSRSRARPAWTSSPATASTRPSPGVECVIDAATGPSPDEQAATEFFTTAARNLQEPGERAGVRRIVVVSIVGVDRFTGGYNAAKVAQEQTHLAGPIPVAHPARHAVPRVRRAAHGLGPPGRRGLRVAHAHAARRRPHRGRGARRPGHRDQARPGDRRGPIREIAGPREESLVEAARRLAARRGDPVRVEAVDRARPALSRRAAPLPGPDAALAGPTFDEWLDARVTA